MKITLDNIMDFKPCREYPLERVERLMGGRESVSALDILNTKLDSLDDILWLVLRPEVLPERMLHEISIYCAEEVLPIFERVCPNDSRPRDAIEAKKRWLCGEITTESRNAADAACDAARSAAWDAAWSAARNAADAACDATWNAAWDAAWSAARSAAWDARNAARSATWNAAWDAAWDAVGDAEWNAAWDAAGDAARNAFNEKLIMHIKEKLK